MGPIFQFLDQKKTIIILCVMLLFNASAFIIPGMPGNLQEISRHSLDLKPPDLIFFYTPDEISTFLSAIGSEGRQAFQTMHLTVDFSFPLIYGLLFILLIRHKWQRFMWVGLFPTIMDLSENFSLGYITHHYPDQKPIIGRLAQLSTISKFTLIFLYVVFVGCHVCKFKRKTKQKHIKT